MEYPDASGGGVVCSHCGTVIDETATKCGYCGRAVSGDTADPQQSRRGVRPVENQTSLTKNRTTHESGETLGGVLLVIIPGTSEWSAKSKAKAASQMWGAHVFSGSDPSFTRIGDSTSIQSLVSAYGFPSIAKLPVYSPEDDVDEDLEHVIGVVEDKGGFENPGDHRTPFGKSIAVNVINEDGKPFTSRSGVREALTKDDQWVYTIAVHIDAKYTAF